MKNAKFWAVKKIIIFIFLPVLFFTLFAGLSHNAYAMEAEPPNYRVADYINHTVVSGDTLWSIARKHGVTVAEIMSANPGITESGAIFIGQIIKIPQAYETPGEPATETEKESVTYLFAGNTTSYLKTIANTKGSVKTVNPDYFDLTIEGSLLVTPANKIDTAFISEMHRRKIKVIPFISNHWDRSLGNIALINRQSLSSEIAAAVEQYGLDGINIDIENVNEQYRDMYTDFARLLREKIPTEKEVTVAVAANPKGWNVGWHGSYDYNGLSRYCDYLMIMSYDESYYGGPAGPVSSSAFFENSIKYALNQNVSREKIVAGLPFFGRYWKDGESVGGNGITFGDIEFLIKNYDSQLDYDDESKSAFAKITIKSEEALPTVWGGRTLTSGIYNIWYDNADSVEYKLGLINSYGIRGAGSWALGQEDSSVWDFYTKVLNGISSEDITEPPLPGLPGLPSTPQIPELPALPDLENQLFEPAYPIEPDAGPLPLPNINLDKPSITLPYPSKKNISHFRDIQKTILDAGNTVIELDSKISIGEFSVILSKLSHLSPEKQNGLFTSGHWSSPYMDMLISRHIINKSASNNNPENRLTRKELAACLDSVLVLPDTVSLNSLPFSDINHQCDSYYSMAKLSFFGVMNMDDKGRFRPDDAVTAGELANAFEIIEESGFQINADKIIMENYLGKLIIDPA